MNLKMLKNRNFTLLIFGRLVSLLGSRIQSFALSIYVLAQTGSAAQFASLLAITMLPNLILGPVAGIFVDRWDRKKIIVYLDLLNGALIGITAIVFWVNGELSLGYIYAVSIVFSIISLLFGPASSTVIPTVVEKEQLIEANSMNAFVLSIGRLVAPAIAGVIYGFYGLFAVLVVNAISFILSAISEMFIVLPKLEKKESKMNYHIFKEEFLEGVRFVRGNQLIFSITTVATVLNFAFTPIMSIGMIFILKEMMLITDAQYGIMQSVIVVGSMVAPIITPKVSKKIKLGTLFFWHIIIVSGLFFMAAFISSSLFRVELFSNSAAYYMLMAVNFLVALLITTGNIALGTINQKNIPLELLGRVGTFRNSMVTAVIPLGQILFGFLFDNLDAWICLTISGSILLVTIIAFRKSFVSKTVVSSEADTEEVLKQA